MDGILGMAPNYQTGAYSTGPLFIDFLKYNGVIDNRIFSFLMKSKDDTSFVEIGSFSESNMLDPSALIWLDMTYAYYWLADISAYRVGESDYF